MQTISTLRKEAYTILYRLGGGYRYSARDAQFVDECACQIAIANWKYDPAKGKRSTYVFRVVKNMVHDRFKKQHKVTQFSQIPKLNKIEESGLKSTVEEIRELVHKRCHPRLSNIFDLKAAGHDFVEIGLIIGISKQRVSQLWKNVIKIVREEYNNVGY